MVVIENSKFHFYEKSGINTNTYANVYVLIELKLATII